MPDDGFGGPLPDDAHLTGVILRLNPDGSAPRYNPFFKHGEDVGGEVGENIQKIFAYGVRNGFGMAFDPVSKRLWAQENGDDSYSELNLVEDGLNSGWLQIMGPAHRVADFKAIETSDEFFGMQQTRYSPENLADTPAEALSRLTMFPGAHFSDPEMAWRYEVGPGGMGFQEGTGLGREYRTTSSWEARGTSSRAATSSTSS